MTHPTIKLLEDVLPFFEDTDEYLSDNFGEVVLYQDLIAAALRTLIEKHEDVEGVDVDYKVLRAVEQFKQIKLYAKHDPFLEVYSRDNRRLYRVTEEDFDTVLQAAMRGATEYRADTIINEITKRLEKDDDSR